MKPRAPVNLQALQSVLGSGLIWLAVAFLLVMMLAFSTIRIGAVSGEQVGILLDRISGDIEVIDQSGKKIYNGLLSDFYVLDKTLQTLEMTEVKGRGDRAGKDDLKIKTKDGSDVYVDLKVQYKIDSTMAREVITTSGTGDHYKKKWARDYTRTVSRNFLGELTTEEFYDSSKRDARLVLARTEVNEKLQPFGIRIDSIVIPKRPHFYEDYEAMIKKKKLADQAVLEEQSKAMAAKQRQQTMIVEETNRKNVAVEEYKGEMQRKVIAARAEAERTTKEADAYYEQVTVAASAKLYQMEKAAEGTLAQRSAEAEGIQAMNKALEGEGGHNMVMLEYAKKLNGMKILGKPFTVQGHIERFEHLKGPASTGRE